MMSRTGCAINELEVLTLGVLELNSKLTPAIAAATIASSTAIRAARLSRLFKKMLSYLRQENYLKMSRKKGIFVSEA